MPSLTVSRSLLPLPGFFENFRLENEEKNEKNLVDLTNKKLENLKRRSNILGINPKLFEI
jgi:hypothetical protein